MSILDELFELDPNKILNEAPGDDDAGGETVDASPNAGNDNPDDNTGGDNDAGNTDDNQDTNADDNNDDQQQDDNNQDNDNQGDQENDDNFDINTDDTGGDDEGGDEGGEDTGGDNADTSDANTDEPSEEAKTTKDEYDKIYKDLTPEERANRDMILKQNFKELHRICGDLIHQTSYFPNTESSQKLVKRLISSLHNFRKYIAFYLTNIYSTKSHIENRIEYEKYQQIFNGIKSIYQQFEGMLAHKDETDNKGN